MNRTNRLAGIILILQSGECQTAARLATRFDVSRRTILRDIDALSQIGVPIVAVPGPGGSLQLHRAIICHRLPSRLRKLRFSCSHSLLPVMPKTRRLVTRAVRQKRNCGPPARHGHRRRRGAGAHCSDATPPRCEP